MAVEKTSVSFKRDRTLSERSEQVGRGESVSSSKKKAARSSGFGRALICSRSSRVYILGSLVFLLGFIFLTMLCSFTMFAVLAACLEANYLEAKCRVHYEQHLHVFYKKTSQGRSSLDFCAGYSDICSDRKRRIPSAKKLIRKGLKYRRKEIVDRNK